MQDDGGESECDMHNEFCSSLGVPGMRDVWIALPWGAAPSAVDWCRVKRTSKGYAPPSLGNCVFSSGFILYGNSTRNAHFPFSWGLAAAHATHCTAPPWWWPLGSENCDACNETPFRTGVADLGRRVFLSVWNVFFFGGGLFRPAPVAYEGSQARVWSEL